MSLEQRVRIQLEEISGMGNNLIYARTFDLDIEHVELFQQVLDQVIFGAKIEKLDPSVEVPPDTVEALRVKGVMKHIDDPNMIERLLIKMPLGTFLTFRLDVVKEIPGIKMEFIATGGSADYLIFSKKIAPWVGYDHEFTETYLVAIVSAHEERHLVQQKVGGVCFIYLRDPDLEKAIPDTAPGWMDEAPGYALFYGPTLYQSEQAQEKGIRANIPRRLDGEEFF